MRGKQGKRKGDCKGLSREKGEWEGEKAEKMGGKWKRG